MLTVEYSFYTSSFKGKTAEDDFNRLAVKASAYLDCVTSDRITDNLPAPLLQRASLALCAVVDALLLGEQGGGVAAESNDGVSVTYVSGVNSKTDNRRLQEAVGLFLGGTGLLYRGVE